MPPIFYKMPFLYKSAMCLQFFDKNNVGKKAARKMLVKGVNFTNILQTPFS